MAVEPITLSAAFATANHAVTILKGITSTLKTMGKAEVMNDLIDLQTAILEMQQKQAELFSENQALKEENRKLRETADERAKLKYNGRVYWRNEDNSFFCPTCFDSTGKLIRVESHQEKGRITWVCKLCTNVFRGS